MKKLILTCTSFVLCIGIAIGVISSIKPVDSLANTFDDLRTNMMLEIEEQVQDNPELAWSSNPYDYIKNNDAYDSIVEMKLDALPLIDEQISNSENDGLEEYLLAIAAEEICKINLKQDETGNYNWETAKGFVSEWNEYLVELPDKVESIIESDMAQGDKEYALLKLGTPAAALIYRYISEHPSSYDNMNSIINILMDDSNDSVAMPFNTNGLNDDSYNFDSFLEYLDNKNSK